MQATPTLNYRIVNAPGQRYHPAIIAQAAATLAELFPNRFWLTVGSGQDLNEHITGDRWLAKCDRNTRLKECVDIIRALWAGETVTHRGLVTVEEAKLYSRPEVQPLIIGAAVTAETAQWVGSWADGLITEKMGLELRASSTASSYTCASGKVINHAKNLVVERHTLNLDN